MNQKIIRVGIVALIFVAMLSIQGMPDGRAVNQIVFMLAMISLFSLLLKNVWVTLFVLLTVFLYAFFKFSTGHTYLTNIFLGSILYLITKVSFKKEHIDFFINGFLWFVFANVAYMAVQASSLDFIFSKIVTEQGFAVAYTNIFEDVSERLTMNGFMGHQSILGVLMALAVPILASRRSMWSTIGAIGLFIPLIIAKTSLPAIAGMIGLMFVLFYQIPRKVWVIGVLAVLLCGVGYIKKVDSPGIERLSLWRSIARDGMAHPITGWGLDSFANITPQKDFRYSNRVSKYPYHQGRDGKTYTNITHIEWWDNPHNLYLSLFFEFGFVSLFLLVGYLRQNILRFQKAIKNQNVIGLAGFMLVFFTVSFGHFPAFLARIMCFSIPMFALYEVEVEYDR